MINFAKSVKTQNSKAVGNNRRVFFMSLFERFSVVRSLNIWYVLTGINRAKTASPLSGFVRRYYNEYRKKFEKAVARILYNF